MTGKDNPAGEAAVRPGPRARRTLSGLVFAALGMLALGWMLLHLHPGGNTDAGAPARLDLLGEIESFANNAASDALADLVYIPRIYSIPESATVAPAPDPVCFGSTEDPQEILSLIDSAAFLMDGQEAVFDPEADFVPGSPIRYYFDETILAIAWREIVDGCFCTFAEVKVQDGSQLRRKLAGDACFSGRQFYASDMTREANAVLALNGDFYGYRGVGHAVYQRQVYRSASGGLDACFITASGEMLFAYGGTLEGEAALQSYVDENDVVFALSFGPVLVDNGELKNLSHYRIGEGRELYSRSALGMTGPLHYVLMTVNKGEDNTGGATTQQAAQFMYDKGCVQAYNLDGGQSAVMLLGGEIVNYLDYGTERVMSDIIYFATALPEKEGAG